MGLWLGLGLGLGLGLRLSPAHVFVGCRIILICLVFVRWGAQGGRLPLRTDPVVYHCGVVVTRPLLWRSSGEKGGRAAHQAPLPGGE